MSTVHELRLVQSPAEPGAEHAETRTVLQVLQVLQVLLLLCDSLAVACAATTDDIENAYNGFHIKHSVQSTFLLHLWTCFADNIELAPTLDDTAGVT